MIFAEVFREAASLAGITLTDKQYMAFSRYYEMLVSWNEKINLTAITAPEEVAVKHFIDSLSCYDSQLFQEKSNIADVGTGAGFPGIPLKILLPDLQLTLMDSLKKRLVFLQEVVDCLELSGVNIIHIRAEEAGRQREYREKYDIVLSRAVARLNTLAELCIPLVKPGGYFCAMKGAQYQVEVEEASNAIDMLGGKIVTVRQIKLPGLDDVRAIIYVNKIVSTPASFPRKPGVPEKKPL